MYYNIYNIQMHYESRGSAISLSTDKYCLITTKNFIPGVRATLRTCVIRSTDQSAALDILLRSFPYTAYVHDRASGTVEW